MALNKNCEFILTEMVKSMEELANEDQIYILEKLNKEKEKIKLWKQFL